MSTLQPTSVLNTSATDEVRATAGRRMARLSDSGVTDFNKTLQTAEAWQRKLIMKTNIKAIGKEGEGKIKMVRRPILFNVANMLSSLSPSSSKPVWIVGIAIKWVPTCDLATTGTISVSIQNKSVINPVLLDHTVVSMTQRVTTPFEVQYTSSSKLSPSMSSSSNPWMYTYEIEGMDDAPDSMDLGDIIIMPMIKADEDATQLYCGVKCNVYSGYFPLNIPIVTYCAPGPRFKTNVAEVRRNIEMLKRYLNVQGFTNIDDDLVFTLIQCCDGEATAAILPGMRSQAWMPLDKASESYNIIKSMIHDCRTGRIAPYVTLAAVENLGNKGGNKPYTYT